MQWYKIVQTGLHGDHLDCDPSWWEVTIRHDWWKPSSGRSFCVATLETSPSNLKQSAVIYYNIPSEQGAGEYYGGVIVHAVDITVELPMPLLTGQSIETWSNTNCERALNACGNRSSRIWLNHHYELIVACLKMWKYNGTCTGTKILPLATSLGISSWSHCLSS